MSTLWRSFSPLTRRLALFLAANAVLVPALLIGAAATPVRETGLRPTVDFLLMREDDDDSWRPMFEALAYIQSGHRESLYEELFFQQRKKFQYPPPSLLVTWALQRIGPAGGYPHARGYVLVGVARALSWLCVVGVMVAAAMLFAASLAASNGSSAPPPGSERLVWGLMACLATATFYPITASYTYGQIQTLINTLAAVMFWAWVTRRQRLAGILASVICLVKPQYALLLVWGVVRKQWRFVRAGAVTGAIVLAVSIVAFGLANHLDYLNVLSYLGRHGEAYYPNQSVNGLLERWFANGDSLHSSRWFPPFHPVVFAGTLVTSGLLAIAALWPTKGRQGGVEDFAIAALTATMASPIAWEHHYGILLPIYAVLLPNLLQTPVFGRLTFPLLGLSYVLASGYFAVVNRFAYAPDGLNVLQSYLFVGALMVLLCLYRLRSRPLAETASNLRELRVA